MTPPPEGLAFSIKRAAHRILNAVVASQWRNQAFPRLVFGSVANELFLLAYELSIAR
jgi:hypothetical protein